MSIFAQKLVITPSPNPDQIGLRFPYFFEMQTFVLHTYTFTLKINAFAVLKAFDSA